MKKNIKIGILGGMGPFASSYFLQLLLKKISEKNINMPEIILDSVPIKDFISNPTEIKPSLITLKSRVKKMNKFGVDLIVMICNTAHILHHQLSTISTPPFPSLIDLVVKNINDSNLTRIGLIATPMTIKTHLYTDKLLSNNYQIFLPHQNLEVLIEKQIRKATVSMAAFDCSDHLLAKEIQKFIKVNTLDGLILGCTELPLFFPKEAFSAISIIDCQEVLANYVISFLNVKI